MKSLVFDGAAEVEFDEAIDFHEDQTEGLGGSLRPEVWRALEFLRANPQLCPPLRGTPYRKRRVSRFSYVVYFLELPGFIWIAAIAHSSRRPGYWSERASPD